jgi:phosphoribosylglycinamide formyltransferase 1
LKIAVFVSGRGSNLKAILNSPELKNIVNVVAVFSDKPDCAAFKIADEFSIKTYLLNDKNSSTTGLHEIVLYDNIAAKLNQLEIDFIVLAGFLKLIPGEVVRKYQWNIINIHPALLPSFGGKGMYGIKVHRAVFNSSAKVSGATVHFVDDSYDTGKIIYQECVNIADVKSPEEIAEKVLEIEHKILPYVICKAAERKIKLQGDRIFIEK